MQFEEQKIPGVFIIRSSKIGDERGYFFRSYCSKEMAEITQKQFVQMNISFNQVKGTLRGLHFQKPPFSEQKIVRCITGSIWDVFLDIRSDSPTFLKWGAYQLNANSGEALFIPEGIAHGFVTLENDTIIHYSHSDYYQPLVEDGFHYNDPMLQITWPITPTIVSERDQNHRLLTNEFKGIQL